MRAFSWFVGLALASVITFGPATGLHAQTLNIAYIDSQAILLEAPGAREAQEEFERQMDSFAREIDALGEELDNLIAQYQQQQSTLVQSVREAREAEIRQKDQRLQQRLDEMEYEAQITRQQLVEPILAQMSEVIEAIRAEGNYAMIFDVAGQSIVAADPALDRTDAVLERLRQMASQP